MTAKFVVDVMLGSLSRWLRLFGFDTLYRNDFTDRELVKISLEQERILLTKDNALSKTKALRRVLLIKAQTLEEQLLEVLVYVRKMGFEIGNTSPRCPLCNGLIEKVSKELVREEIPDYVYHNINDFFSCSDCKKIYWPGSHIGKIDSVKERILRSMS